MARRYECGIDFSAVDAIDFHTHVEVDSPGHCAYDAGLAEATRRYFKLGADDLMPIDELAEIPGVGRPLAHRAGERILAAITRE